MQIPIPIFKFIDVTIFPDTFWGGFVGAWMFLGFISLVILTRADYRSWKKESYLSKLEISIYCISVPFLVLFAAYHSEKKSEKRIEELEAQLKKRKR